MHLTDTQATAMQAIDKWYTSCDVIREEVKAGKKEYPQPWFYLGGFAGTGKTTLVKFFREQVSGMIKYAAYTGKAAMQMRKQEVNASTVHYLIYEPVDDKDGKPSFQLRTDSDLRYAKLLVLDECSMVNQEIGKDLLSFNVPILVLGDPGQLPPVKGTAFFTGLRPDVMLEEVHRQALDSPILRLATDVRRGKPIKRESSDGLITYPGRTNLEELLPEYEQVITGKNATRQTVNTGARYTLGFRPEDNIYPLEGERLICLRNNPERGLFNGLLCTVLTNSQEVNDDTIKFNIRTELDQTINNVYVLKNCFHAPDEIAKLPYSYRKHFDEFDYGYCVTCHKSQGSQWDNVLIVDDGMLVWNKVMRRKWMYTAITRAAEKLTIVRA